MKPFKSVKMKNKKQKKENKKKCCGAIRVISMAAIGLSDLQTQTESRLSLYDKGSLVRISGDVHH